MGKKRRDEKLKRRTIRREPPSTKELLRTLPGVLLRSFLVVVPSTILMLLLGNAGLTFLLSPVAQIIVYVGLFLLFRKFIYGPIMPGRGLPPKK
jgi:hypothetical protein